MPTRVLLVDDDDLVLASYARALDRPGIEHVRANNGDDALKAARASAFDVVISDINMPTLSGIDLLRETRRHDLDLPIILATGDPQLSTAMTAVELGAFAYLQKPVNAQQIVALVERAALLHRMARTKRDALEILGNDERLLGDRASLEERFTAAMNAAFLVFQPIVSFSEKRVVAYEALLRTEEATLRNPVAFISAAERLKKTVDLGRHVRTMAAASMASSLSEGISLFVNLHPLDLIDDELTDPRSPLAAHAKRVVLEITERASLEHVEDVARRVAALQKMGYRLAVDDLGAGYAGLTSLTALSPEVVKIDMSLVRDIDTDERRQRVVSSLLSLSKDLSMTVVLEGIETVGERDTLARMGGDIMQGYFFAKPNRVVALPDAATFAAR